MNFARYFRISSYCLVASGFVAIAATGSVDLFSLSLFGTALVTSWFLDTERLKRSIPVWLLNSIALLAFPFYLVDYMLISRSFVVSTVHLIFLMAAAKLMTRATDRDYVYLYFVSFAELLAASTLTVDVTFTVSLFVFLISCVSTLILFEMKRSHARAQHFGKIEPLVTPAKLRGTGLELFSPFPAGSLFCITLGMTIAILAISVPIFFLTPRITLGIYNRPTGKTQMLSGFSETVELGEIGTIKESDAVVMRVRATSSAPVAFEKLKWRGIALDHYDGRAWSRSPDLRNRARVDAPDRRFFVLEQYALGGGLLKQVFFVEALSTSVVFASHKALAISRDLISLDRDRAGSLFTSRNAFSKMRYEAISDIIRPDPSRIPDVPGPHSEDIRRLYLQLPDLDSRIGDLAREVTRGTRSYYRKAQLLENYLKSRYGYSLELKGTPNSKDPLAMFLFEVRRGHCEYFASAMTIMLRHLNIPARLVNGFRAGEFNQLGEAWIVRQYNAHSWVEAYFPPYGWIEFDPTPPDPVRSRPAFLRALSNLADALDLWWSEEVVNYTFWKQISLLSSARTQMRGLRRDFRSWVGDLFRASRSRMDRIDLRDLVARHGMKAAVLLAALLILYFAFLRHRMGWWQQLFRSLSRLLARHDTGRVVVSFYGEALDLLQGRGFIRSHDQTPLEFAVSLGAHPAAVPFTELTRLYYRVRFGPRQVAADTGQARALLNMLKLNLKQRRASA